MRRFIFPLMAVAIVAAVASPAARPTPSFAQGEPKAAEDPAAFNPMMGALMNMFIQPRHAKLGIAGREATGRSPATRSKSCSESLAKISAAIPRWKGLPVPDLFDAALTEPLAALEAAVKARDAAPVRRGIRAVDRRMQRLPRHHGPSVRGAQGAGGLGISRPGVQAAVGIPSRTELRADHGSARCRVASTVAHSTFDADIAVMILSVLVVIAANARGEFVGRRHERLARSGGAELRRIVRLREHRVRSRVRRRSTIAGGVPTGANSPCQIATSYPG